MQGDRLESEEKGPVNASQEASRKFRSAYGDIELAPHTDEELSNIQFVPGLTMEQLQAQKTGVKVHQLSHSENETLAQSEESPLKHLERTSEKTKNKRRVKSMINNLGPVLRLCILTYQLTHAYFIVVYIAPTFENPFSVWLVQLMSLAIYLTTTVNYHVTGHIPSLSVKRTREESFLPRQGYKCCDRCENIWKPDRTHHCSIQKHCVTRMDHYCPITLTTIGMRNHGSFFMTSIGHGLACAIWLALYPVYYVYNFRALARGNITKTVLVTGLGFGDYLCVLSIFALSLGIIFAHLILIFNNATTLEGVPGEQHLFKEVRASSYNLSPLYNLRQFYSVAFGLLPLQAAFDANKYEGYYFHKVGVTKERFGMNADKNDFHMFGGTRLELQDDQIAVIGHKLYDGVDLVVKGSGQSRVAAPKETPGQPEVSLRATSLNDSAI